jgi:hypothetical protein
VVHLSGIGTFTAQYRDEAVRSGWVMISMKDDWKRIFPFEKSARSPQIRAQHGQRRRVPGGPIRALGGGGRFFRLGARQP